MDPKRFVINTMKHMLKAGLTDYSGGNMALRHEEKIYSTPGGASVYQRWDLEPGDIIVTNIEQEVLEGDENKVSSESDLHHGILKRFPHVNCSIHGNTHYSPLLASLGLEIKGIRDEAKAFKIRKVIVVPRDFPMFSDDEKNYIYDSFKENMDRGEAFAAVMHGHGTIVAHEDPHVAFVLFNVVEANSRYIYEREVLSEASRVAGLDERLQQAEKTLKELKGS